MKAFAYIRVSGKTQVDGDGPDRQREKIRAFAVANNVRLDSGENLPEYFDEGVSGTVDGLDRPALVEFFEYIDLVRSGETDAPWADSGAPCLIVERMDRLARDLMVQEMLLAECRKRRIAVFAADQGLIDQVNDGGDPTRTLIRQILGAVSQWEKSVIVMKLKSARDKRRRETGRCGGVLPFGQLPGEAHTVRQLMGVLDMGASLKQAAEHLNMMGFKTRSGKEWTRSRVFEVARANKKSI